MGQRIISFEKVRKAHKHSSNNGNLPWTHCNHARYNCTSVCTVACTGTWFVNPMLAESFAEGFVSCPARLRWLASAKLYPPNDSVIHQETRTTKLGKPRGRLSLSSCTVSLVNKRIPNRCNNSSKNHEQLNLKVPKSLTNHSKLSLGRLRRALGHQLRPRVGLRS